jgi:dynein heavy chain
MTTLLERLKKTSVQQSHWDKILKEIGSEGAFNMKTGKVSQVLELKLQDHAELLTKVLEQADQEFRNEETLRDMEKIWRELKFEMLLKGDQEDTPLIRGIEDIREKLDDCVTRLQYISGNKYVHAVRDKVAVMQKNMNTINDVTEMWMKVQTKWINLKIIFATSTDIRQKLSDITAKFDATNKRFKKIMDMTYKTPNVLQACKADGRLEELTSISHELDRCQKALSTYLESKRLEYPDFTSFLKKRCFP